MASEYNQTGYGYSYPGSYPHTTFYQHNGRYNRTNFASPVTVNFPQAAYHHNAGAVDFADFISQLTQMILAMVMMPVYMIQTVAVALFSVVKVAFWVIRLVIRLGPIAVSSSMVSLDMMTPER
ncbi:hypothetical protein ABEF95_007686 [Exophiala dermatitidis]